MGTEFWRMAMGVLPGRLFSNRLSYVGLRDRRNPGLCGSHLLRPQRDSHIVGRRAPLRYWVRFLQATLRGLRHYDRGTVDAAWTIVLIISLVLHICLGIHFIDVFKSLADELDKGQDEKTSSSAV